MGVWVAIWIACGFVAMLIAGDRKIGAFGAFLLGVLLGPIGILIAAVSGQRSPLEKIEAKPSEAGWHPDPLGRFTSRWYDGRRWTQHVGRVQPDGTREQLEDPL